MKHVLLAGAMLVAAPALAQTKADPSAQAPGRTPMAQPADTVQVQTAPQTAVPATPDTATPAATAPADQSAQAADPMTTGQAQAAQTAPSQTAPSQTAPSQTAPSQPAVAQQPASSGSQVAQIVDSEFPTYDKDGDGKLNRTEFAAWMVALKTASDPSTKADAPATRTWVAGAFAQADKDKSASLTKSELTGFLSPGKS